MLIYIAVNTWSWNVYIRTHLASPYIDCTLWPWNLVYPGNYPIKTSYLGYQCPNLSPLSIIHWLSTTQGSHARKCYRDMLRIFEQFVYSATVISAVWGTQAFCQGAWWWHDMTCCDSRGVISHNQSPCFTTWSVLTHCGSVRKLSTAWVAQTEIRCKICRLVPVVVMSYQYLKHTAERSCWVSWALIAIVNNWFTCMSNCWLSCTIN